MLTEEEIKAQLAKINLRLKQFKDLGCDMLASRKFILAKAEIVPEILDLGTGRGHMAIAIAETGENLTSLDCDDEMLQVAAARAKSLGFGNQIKFVLGDVTNLPFADNSFATVISADMWHHLSDHGKALDEMLRVWSGQGNLVLADMNRQGLVAVAKRHAEDGGHHDEGKLYIDQAEALLKERGIKFKRYEGESHVVFVAEN